MAEPGTRLGRYTLHERINAGGTSEIWLATDDSGVSYAVRLMLDNRLLNFTERKRFLTGAEVLQSLPPHPAIIGYVEHGKIGGEIALVMEYVEGENLKLRLNANDPVLAENIAQVLIDLSEALEHLHDHGFMHLDFKPENVVMTRNGSIRLIDFDLAQPIPNPPRKLDRNPGTPLYMAPEQLLRQAVDHRADIWAFGVTAYELLTSRKPFPGESPDVVLRRQLDRADFIPPRTINPEIPVALERIILRCLERDPDRRYPITSVLAHEIRQALYVS
jgi:serine/threonine-protein kinase